MWQESKELLAVWIAAVAAAIAALMARILQQRRILLVEGADDGFTVRVSPATTGAPPPAAFRLVQGRAEPPLGEGWRAALRGSHLDVLLRPEQVLFRSVDFPKAVAWLIQ